ncbi:MAG: hypothetical protein V4555_01365 [Acidobacteriota bacterium]
MRRLVLLFAILSSCTLLHAQGFSIYFTSTNTHFTNVVNGQSYNPTGSTYTSLFTDSWPAEFGGGITLNAVHTRAAQFGLDLRGSTNHGNTGADTAMAGPRLAFRIPLLGLKPYVAAEGGYVATRTTGSLTVVTGGVPVTTHPIVSNQYAAWEVFGGVDVPIFPHLDFRAIELGGGKGYLASNGIQSVNLNNQNTAISLFSIDTGIVVHF